MSKKPPKKAVMHGPDYMHEVHDKKIDMIARVNNYHYQHYTTFLQSNFPFLYEEFETVKQEECTRDQAEKNMEARVNSLIQPVSGQSELSGDEKFHLKTSETNPKSPGGNIQDQYRAMIGNTEAGIKQNYKLMSAGVQLDKKLKGARGQQSFVLRPMNEQDQIALIKYEKYIKHLVKTLYKLKGKKFGNHHKIDEVDKIFDKIQNKILIGMQDGKLKSDSYKSHFQNMKKAIDDSLLVQIEERQKLLIMQRIKDGLTTQVEQFKLRGLQPPEDLELAMQKVEEEEISITQSVTDRSSARSPARLIGRDHSLRIEESPFQLKSIQKQGEEPAINQGGQCCDHDPESPEMKRISLKEKFQMASRQFGTLHDKVFQLDGCHQTHDLQFMQRNVEESPVYKLLDKEEITEKIMRLGLVTNPGNTVDGFCDIGGRNQGLINKLERKLTKELKMKFQTSRHDSSYNVQQVGTNQQLNESFKSQEYRMKRPSQKFNQQTLKLQNTEALSSMTQSPLLPFNSINTEQQQKLDYKDKVIKDIVQKRQKRIKEIRQTMRRSIAKRETAKFYIEPEIPLQQKGPHRRGQSVNVSLANYQLGKIQKADNYHGYFLDENQDAVDYKSLEKNFKKYLRKYGALDEASDEDSAFIGYDKFGRKRCQYLEDMMAQMLRPRDLIEGEYSLGEQKVLDQLKKMRYVGKKPGMPINLSNLSEQAMSSIKYEEDIVRIDSLVESAFNSEENAKWDDYQYSKFNPSISERSEEKHDIHSAAGSEPELDDDHDQFSEYNDSGSSMTSNYSDTDEPGQSCMEKIELEQAKKNIERLQREEEENDNFDNKSSAVPSIQEVQVRITTNNFIKREMIITEIENKYQDLKRLTFCKILKGFKFLMSRHDQKSINSIQQIIEHSKTQMRLYKLKQMQINHSRRKKLSLSFIDEISKLYQSEFGATPFEIVDGIQVSGNLYYKNYKMSPIQMNCVSILIPYIVNLRHINLEECGMKDEQLSFIIQACQGLSKIKEICIGRNQIGPMTVKNFKNSNLKFRVHELDVNNLEKLSPLHFQDLITNLKGFINLQFLNISGNKVSEKASEALTHLVENSKTLETLLMRGCFHQFQPAKVFLKSLVDNQVLRSLDISESNLRHNESDCGSHIGRILLNNNKLVHLNLNECKLNSSEIIYIVLNLMENDFMMVIHLGFNDLDEPSKNLCKILLGVETEESLLYMLNMDKRRQEVKQVNNKNCDFLISRTLKKQWTGTPQEAYSPELNEWQIQDSQPFYGDGTKAFNKTDCWICNSHNHLSIESQSLLEQHQNTMEIEKLSNIFTDIQNQKPEMRKMIEKDNSIVNQTNQKELPVNLQLKPITEILKDHNTQDSQSECTAQEAQDLIDPMLNTNILQTMNSGKNREVQNSTVLEDNSSQFFDQTGINSSDHFNDLRSHSHQRYKTLDPNQDIGKKKSEKVSRFYNFEKYQDGMNVLPLSKNIKYETLKGLLEKNQIYYNSNIQSKPLEAQALQGQLSKINEFNPDRLDEINSKLDSFQQFTSQNGVMYKDIQMRSDLLYYSDSSNYDEQEPLIYDQNDETLQQINIETQLRKRNTKFMTDGCNAFRSTIQEKQTNQSNKKESQRNNAYGNRPKTQQGRGGLRNVDQQFNMDKMRMSHPDQKDIKESLQQSNSGKSQIQSFLNKRHQREGVQTINTSINFKEDQGGSKNQQMFSGINEQFDDSQIDSQRKDLVSSGVGLSNHQPTETRASTQFNKSRMKSIPTEQSIVHRNKNNFTTLNPMDSNVASMKMSQYVFSNHQLSPPAKPARASNFLSINQIQQKVDKKCKNMVKKQEKQHVQKLPSNPIKTHKNDHVETIFFDLVSGNAKKVAKLVDTHDHDLNNSNHQHMVKIVPDYDHMTKNEIRNASHKPQYRQFFCVQDLMKKLSFQWHVIHLRNQPIKEDVVYIVGTFTDWMPIEMDNFQPPQEPAGSESGDYTPSRTTLHMQSSPSKSPGHSWMKFSNNFHREVNGKKQELLSDISEINKDLQLKDVNLSNIKKDTKSKRHFKTKLKSVREAIKNDHGGNNQIKYKSNKYLYPKNILKQATDLYKQQIQLKKQIRKELGQSSRSNTMSDLLVDSDRDLNPNMENDQEQLRNEQDNHAKRADLFTGSILKKQLKKDNKTLQTNKDQQKTSLVTYQKHRMNSIISQEMKRRIAQKLQNQFSDMLNSGIANLYEQKKRKLIPEDIQFVKYVVPGTHYFFFLKNGKCFVNNRFEPDLTKNQQEKYHPYDLVEYPGTKIKMNCILVKERQTNFGIIKPVQILQTNNKPKPADLSKDVKFGGQIKFKTMQTLGVKKYQTSIMNKTPTDQTHPNPDFKLSQTMRGNTMDNLLSKTLTMKGKRMDNILEEEGDSFREDFPF